MRRVILLCLVFLCFVVNAHAGEITWQNISREIYNVRTVVVHPNNPRLMFLGTEKGVILKSVDAGESWHSVLTVKGSSNAVNSLIFQPDNTNALYAATGNGLYYTNNQGRSWKRIFKGKNYLENWCTSVLVSRNSIVLGTKAGLFISEDQGRFWKKEISALGNTCIIAIDRYAKDPDIVYAACWEGVFKSGDGGRHWERIFVMVRGKTEIGNEEYTQESEINEYTLIRDIKVDDAGSVFVVTSRGISKSDDAGKTWNKLSDDGLIRKYMRCIAAMGKDSIYIAGRSMVSSYQDTVWRDISDGLGAEEVRFLTFDKQGNLYIASDKGAFKGVFTKASEFGDESFSEKREMRGTKKIPGVDMVQEAAIKYAEVEIDKIKTWRKQAAKRALLPTLTVGVDNDKNRNISSNTWGTYGTTGPGKYYVGPDDYSNDDNQSWSVTVSWDLGDLIWNDAQTSIDVRSKLMVELRGQIIDEVTKLYFERLRLKEEIDELAFEDRKKRFEKELKFREVTAMLDGMTGGYFSREIK